MLALSFNVRKDVVFFSENKTKTISRVRMVAGEGPEIIIGGTGTVEGTRGVHIYIYLPVVHNVFVVLNVKQTASGLAVDWVAGNLYWTDLSFKHVMLSRDDGRFQRKLITTDLDHPRGIAVDAVNRYVVPSSQTTVTLKLAMVLPGSKLFGWFEPVYRIVQC